MEMLQALIKQYEGEMAVAQATIRIYMKHSVGIGEHPQHAEEMDTLLAKIADCRDKIEAAESMMDSNPQLL
jgi:hypothetical protein